MEYLVRTKSKKERMEILQTLLTQDFLWHGEKGWTPEKIEKKYSWEKYSFIGVEDSQFPYEIYGMEEAIVLEDELSTLLLQEFYNRLGIPYPFDFPRFHIKYSQKVSFP